LTNLLVIPLLIPLCTAVLLIFFKERVKLQRGLSLGSALLSVAAALVLVGRIHKEGILTLSMGGWKPPFGIVFVGDMLAGLLVLSTSVAALCILLYSFGSIGRQREEHYYYPFFFFLLVGVNGSFLTGDLFNLFVCFEVMLIASYALIVLGGTRKQLKETVTYLIVNVLSSTLFVAAIAYLYAAVGTLNMAHLSQRIAEAGTGGVLHVVAMLLLIVFALKAGLFLFFWLPGSYSAPPSAVRALFGALLTKVGLYAILRTFTLLFYEDRILAESWIGWMAAVTMLLGGLGAVAYRDIPRILNYNVIISAGFIALAVVFANPDAFTGVIYYLLHDMLAKGMLFILGGMIIAAAGRSQLQNMGGMLKRYPLLGWMFLILTLALVGVPPLSGFAGKLLLLRGGFQAGQLALPLIGLASSFLVLYSLIKIFRVAFWGEEKPVASGASAPTRGGMAAASILLCCILVLGLGAEWIYPYVSQAADVLAHPTVYIEAVLKE
jgi:multicomponent Na+:H+ antiporter subunit D